MNTTHVHFLVVPPDHLNELHELEKQAGEADAQERPDLFYRHNQVFVRAAQMAVASVILKREEYKYPASAFWHWMEKHFRGDKESLVVDADEFEVIRSGLSTSRADDLLQWAHEHTPGAGNVDKAVLVEVLNTVVEMVRSVPPGPHGLVYGYFFTDELEPPAPEPEPPPPMSAEDSKLFAERWDRRTSRAVTRSSVDYWPEGENTEGRYILGLLPPDRAGSLRQAYLAVWQALDEQGLVASRARERDLIPQLEHEVLQPTIVTRADAVRAHVWLNLMADWDEAGRCRTGRYPEVATPEMAHELRQRLDALEQEHGGLKGLIEYVWNYEKHWGRDAVRKAYRQVRDLVRRAMERGHGFVWLLDRDW